MSEFTFNIPSGESKRLLTGGKYCPDNIVVTAEVPPVVVEKDVNFYDYDGTLLYSYTLEEAQALMELPPAPTPKRDFLVFQEWNWTLAEIKSVSYKISVGACYVTADNNVYMVVEFTEDFDLTLQFNFLGRATIYWGDGTSEVVSGGSMYEPHYIQHQYPSTGRYTIKVVGVYQTDWYSMGIASENLPPIGDTDRKTNGMLVEFYSGNVGSGGFWNMLRQSYGLRACTLYSSGTAFGSSTFYDCANLEFFVVPKSFTKLSGSCFLGNRSLKNVSLPKGLITFSSNDFDGCDALSEFRVPEGCTALPYALFANDYAIQRVVVPSSVTTIANRALNGLNSCSYLVFEGETPPALEATGAINISTRCTVAVPAASLATYQNATNYGSIAAQMVGV